MYDYWCPTCKKTCDFDTEIELRASHFGDDWDEFHMTCDTQVILLPKKLEVWK